MEFRKSMGIEPGDQVEVFSKDGKIVLVFGRVVELKINYCPLCRRGLESN
jgi:bifunctional DNA-binding transcriptional regulator/antitoxin component of YhaV-PrlF toxin-antitoxin module